MNNTISWIFLFFCIIACSDKNPVSEYPIIDVVNSVGKYKSVYCSDFFSSIELIPLETNKDCLLTDNGLLMVTDSFIFKVSYGGSGGMISASAMRLYVFDRSGKFLNQIGKIGQGPGEHSGLIVGFFLNQENPTVFIEDLRRILEYEFSGKFICSFAKPTIDGHRLSEISYVGNGLFVGQIAYQGNNKYKYCLFNQEGDTVKCFPSHLFFERDKPSISVFDTSLPPMHVDNRIYLNDYMNDTIYILENTNLQPAYIFDFGKYSIPVARMGKSPLERISIVQNFISLSSQKRHVPVGTPNHFFYQLYVPEFLPRPKSKLLYNSFLDDYYAEDEIVYGIYDITQNTNTLLNTDDFGQKGIINDINGGLSFMPKYYAGNGLLVDCWQAETMKEMLTEEYFAKQTIKDPHAHQKLRELLKTLKEDDNPVIVIAKMK